MRPPVTFRVDMLDPTKTFAEIAGEALSLAQLSDIIMAWVKAHPARQGVSMLLEWVEDYGEFE